MLTFVHCRGGFATRKECQVFCTDARLGFSNTVRAEALPNTPMKSFDDLHLTQAILKGRVFDGAERSAIVIAISFCCAHGSQEYRPDVACLGMPHPVILAVAPL